MVVGCKNYPYERRVSVSLVPLGAKLVSLIAIASFAHVCESELPGVQPTAEGNSQSVNKYISSSSDFCYSRKYVNGELSRLFSDPGEGGWCTEGYFCEWDSRRVISYANSRASFMFFFSCFFSF